MRKIKAYYSLAGVLCFLFLVFTINQAIGQTSVPMAKIVDQTQKKSSEKEVSVNVRVTDPTTLVAGSVDIKLWGVEGIDVNSAVFNLKARNILEKKIGGEKVLCTVKKKGPGKVVKAQCINKNEEDLSLFLLQQGYVSADRQEIYGSIYEQPYLNAESQAQQNEKGAWSLDDDEKKSPADVQSQNFIRGSLILMAVFILALGALSFHIMRGFRRVVDIQNQSIELAARERSLRDREKQIIAAMLNAEIRSNISKTEAYLTIYEEILQDFKVMGKAPKYKKSGDIIQKQPALDRSVFDGNTSKLDLLGSSVASDVIHYYARIKTNPDYIEIDPEESEEDVRKMIETAISNAKKMNKLSDELLGSFINNRLIQNVQF